jgi:hypothetical protein
VGQRFRFGAAQVGNISGDHQSEGIGAEDVGMEWFDQNG